MMKITLKEINEQINGHLDGNDTITVSGLSAINDIQQGHLVFAENEQYLSQAENSKAAAVLIPPHLSSDKKPTIEVPNPMMAFGQLLYFFYPVIKRPANIHPGSHIANTAKIGKNTHIGANVVIGEDTKIGDNCVIHSGVVIGYQVNIGNNVVLHPQVTLYDKTILHDNVTIHAASVIGSDGFGYLFDGDCHQKIPHVGYVEIQANVEIGANTVIDKATLGKTVIGEGTKIDNLVQVAHNVELGKHNILCGFTGIAGSTKSGENVVFAADVGVSDHVTIEDNVVLGARTGVPPKKQLRANTTWLGNPARPERKAIEQIATLQRLPALRKTIKELQQRVQQLESELLNTD